jgi:hypothetical protein
MIEEDMTDIVVTLRECAEDSRKTEGDYYADQFATDASVFEEAADAIEGLRSDAARLRLTSAERTIIEWAAGFRSLHADCRAALLGLLERTK